MPYSVFLVEDEIVAREGIRANVDWRQYGFELRGEAADGELALPQLAEIQPDVLITDIRMPFMDGLQLSRWVREQLPRTRIVIISGYDDFDYARESIRLGVAEYLLKPFGAAELGAVLRRLAADLDREQADQRRSLQMERQLEMARPLLREHLLLRLLLADIGGDEALELAQPLSMELRAPFHVVLVVWLEAPATEERDAALQVAEALVLDAAAAEPGAHACRKRRDELLLLLGGGSRARLARRAQTVATAVVHAVQGRSSCRVTVHVGAIVETLDALNASRLAATPKAASDAHAALDVTDSLPPSTHAAISDFLSSGTADEVDGLLEEQYGPWLAAVERSPFMRNYLLLDLYLSAARRAEEWGHDLYAVFPELADLGALSGRLPDGNGFVERCRLVLTRTLTLRNQWAEGERFVLLNRARSFIDGDYANPDLSLADAAAVAGLSPGHFSSLFGKEFGTTFKEYLTRVRMGHARKLLRSTAMRSFEVAAAVGYADPHYFSTVFKKETGQTPREYREAR